MACPFGPGSSRCAPRTRKRFRPIRVTIPHARSAHSFNIAGRIELYQKERAGAHIHKAGGQQARLPSFHFSFAQAPPLGAVQGASAMRVGPAYGPPCENRLSALRAEPSDFLVRQPLERSSTRTLGGLRPPPFAPVNVMRTFTEANGGGLAHRRKGSFCHDCYQH